MTTLLRLLPAPLIRAAGKLQFKLPFLAKPINLLGQKLAGEGVIRRGPGKGLRFDGRGCSPGFVAGTSEPIEQELLVKHLSPGAVFYDVGANAGFYAVIGARAVGPRGQVYAFEPMPKLAERIRENAALNSLTNLTVVEAAAFNQDGILKFALRGSLSMLNSVRGAATAADRMSVASLRIDTFSSKHRPPSLILIDIEGDELKALEGALQTIITFRPVLMVEIHWQGQDFVDFYEQELKPLGYVASTYDGKPLPTELIRYHALMLPTAREAWGPSHSGV